MLAVACSRDWYGSAMQKLGTGIISLAMTVPSILHHWQHLDSAILKDADEISNQDICTKT